MVRRVGDLPAAGARRAREDEEEEAGKEQMGGDGHPDPAGGGTALARVAGGADDADNDAGNGVAKRRRVEGNERIDPGPTRHHPSEYIPGSVMKVVLHNFMTYADVTMEPGPRLNIILGPNGTGKSSFVCALAIGLAGSTKLLGRADKIEEFIKRGESSGSCEITLATEDPLRPLVVKREIKRKDGSSTWKVNGAVMPLLRVKTEMKKLGVQLDNLCQFLPQDRVVEFARMNPEQMLQETEKAIGNGELYDQHKKLIDMKGGIADLEREVVSKRARAEKLRRENESLERDVERFNEREKLLQEVADMQLKMPWLKFEQAKEKWFNAKEELKACKKLLSDKTAELIQYKEPYDARIVERTAAQTEEKEKKRAVTAADNKRVTCSETLNQLYVDSEGQVSMLAQARKRTGDHRRKLAQREETLRDALARQANVPEAPDHSAELNDLKSSGTEMNMELLAVERDVGDLRQRAAGPEQSLNLAERRLREIDSVRGQKLSLLAPKFRNILEGDQWVNEHGNMFHKKVFGPILTLIECADPDHQNYLQATIPSFLFGAYITQDSRDRDTLNARFKGLQLSVINVAEVKYVEPDISHLIKHGITHRLDQLFKADPAVMQAITDGAPGLTKGFVVDPRMSGDDIQKVLNSTEAFQAYTPRTVFAKTTSRYSTEIGLRSSDVRQSTLFRVGGDSAGERATVVEQIRGLRDDKATADGNAVAANQRRVELQAELTGLTKRRHLLTSAGLNARKDQEAAQRSVDQAQDMLRRERPPEDLDMLEKRVAAELEKVTKKRAVKAMELADGMALCIQSLHALSTAALRTAELTEQVKHMKNAYDDRVALSANLEGEKQTLERVCAEAKERARGKKEIAQRDAPMDNFSAEHKIKFAEWPGNVEELQASIDMVENEANAIMCPNGVVLEEFQKRQLEITGLDANLIEAEARLGERQADITTTLEFWLPKVRELVDTVNENFKNNMADMGCAGEVKLNESAGEAYEQWKLEIWVKFRAAEDMHVLTATRQSGGERSVSTMLYLISLQELTRAPFRVVDEINQGMDPVNERKIFKRMTNAASKPSTSQMFLLTPKLLNGLVYTEDCTVMVIFNGPWISEVADRWREIQSAIQPIAHGPVTPPVPRVPR